MKRLVSMLLAVCLMCGVAVMFAGCTPREEKLIISNWGNYLSDETYKGFESWYKEKTGKNVKVEFNEFVTNEELYQKLSVGKADYDLVCPSDYMVERMIRKDMLQKLDDGAKAAVSSSVDPDVLKFSKVYDPTTEYSMPYLWGTMGILYNSKSTNIPTNINSWDVLWDSSLNKQVFMKDSPKDTYTITMLYNKRVELLEAIENHGVDSAEYKAILEYIFNSTDSTKLNAAKTALQKQKSDGIINEYDEEMGKMEILRDHSGSKGLLGMFWSCDAGYIMNGDEDEGSNRDVMYVVPDEGSNVWTDNFVIPKNAVNVDAANWFIRYLCEKDVAYECMDYSGSTTAVLAAATQYREDIESDDAFFAGTAPGFRQMYLDMLFPTQEVLARCGIMRDFGDENNNALSKMWEDVLIS